MLVDSGSDRIERGRLVDRADVHAEALADEFWPPLAVPPLSVKVTVIVARPKALSAGV